MAQWGTARVFKRGSTSIRVIPDVDTVGFDLIYPPVRRVEKVKIGAVLVLDVQGDPFVGATLADEVKAEWTGRPYSEWAEEA